MCLLYFCGSYCEEVLACTTPLRRCYAHIFTCRERSIFPLESLTQHKANRTRQSHLLISFRNYGRVCLLPYVVQRCYIYSAPYPCIEQRVFPLESLTQHKANRTGQSHLLITFRNYGRVCLLLYFLRRCYIYSAPYPCIERREFPFEFDMTEC